MKTIKTSNKKKIVISGVTCFGILVLALGLTMGLLKFSQKKEDAFIPIDGVASTGPVNTDYWTDDVSYVDTEWAGSGTQEDPWKITSAAELAGISYLIKTNKAPNTIENSSGFYFAFDNSYFIQTKNIDLGLHYWTPIGTSALPFTGNYDGNYHEISGLFTSTSVTGGLFDRINSDPYFSTIKVPCVSNLGIVDSYINGAGAFANSGNVSFINCYNKSSVRNTAANAQVVAGGIIGGLGTSINHTNEIVIDCCFNEGKIEANVHDIADSGYLAVAAGIVGSTTMTGAKANIKNCYNKGELVSTARDDMNATGGIIGTTGAYSAGTIANCFNVGILSGNRNGGIVYSLTSSNITDCFAIGNALIYDGKYANIKNSYVVAGNYYKGSSTNATISNVSAISNLATLAKTEAFYTVATRWSTESSWDFSDAWGFDNLYAVKINGGYPVLKYMLPLTWLNYADQGLWLYENAGTADDPILIDTGKKLARIAEFANNGTLDPYLHIKQTADIKLGGHTWVPIGSIEHPFTGYYDGNGYSISGITLDPKINSYQGLFGSVKNSEIKNVNIKESNMKFGIEGDTTRGKNAYGGSIAGYINTSSTISNCTSSARIASNAATTLVGGIVGNADAIYIDNCTFSGRIDASTSAEYAFVGGIVGMASRHAGISNCNVSEADLSGHTVGGIICYGKRAEISSCVINLTNLEGQVVGGLVGHNVNSFVIIEDCLVRANIYVCDVSDSGYVGGFIGNADIMLITVANSCFIGTSNIEINAFYGGDNSASTSNLNNSYSSVNDKNVAVGSNFASGWGLVAGMNNDLPLQKSLFYMAEVSTATHNDIVNLLEEKGFIVI